MITVGSLILSGLAVLAFIYAVTEPSFLNRKKSNKGEVIAQGWKNVTETYDQIMYGLTPLKDMTIDELNNVLCGNCGKRYAVHSVGRAYINDTECVRHTKHSEIGHYLKTAPAIKSEPKT